MGEEDDFLALNACGCLDVCLESTEVLISYFEVAIGQPPIVRRGVGVGRIIADRGKVF